MEMAEADDKARRLMDWLQEHTNRVLIVRKEEGNDSVRVRMRLNEVGFRPSGSPSDGFAGASEIVLHGRGTIMAGRAEMPLPRDRYAIPLAGFGAILRAGGAAGGILVRTGRALYSIAPVHSARR